MPVKLVARTQASRVAKHASSVSIKPKRQADPDDVLTPVEAVLLRKAEREMKQGKFVTLDQLHHGVAAFLEVRVHS
jgi:hypothetical protein